LVQPIGEILLQIRCRWRAVKSSIQLMIAVGRPIRDIEGAPSVGMYAATIAITPWPDLVLIFPHKSASDNEL
jgi:transposase